MALLEGWASAGYVVAAPTFPHTDRSDPALDENDVMNHPGDLRTVIDRILDSNKMPGAVLSGLINDDKIGLVGHSDGADVSLAVAENSCCQDPRVKAAAILSGAELAAFGPNYVLADAVPLLVVQGSGDTINPPACSVQIYDHARAPKYYLNLVGAGHASPYVNSGIYQGIIARVVTDFFDSTLVGQSAASGLLIADGNAAGAAQITDAAVAPPAPGSCPGAPS